MKLMVVYQKRPNNRSPADRRVPHRRLTGSGMVPEVMDKATADLTVSEWLGAMHGTPYWWVTVEPYLWDKEEGLKTGSYTYRCYRYRKDVLGYSDEDACTNRGQP